MPGAAYDGTRPFDVQITAHSPHTFAYKLWIAQQGATQWTSIGTGDDASPPFTSPQAYAAGTHFAYTLLVGGNPNTDWRVQVTLSQGGQTLTCSPAAESGITNDQGAARVDTPVQLG